jgi:hypothetical protein
VIPVDAKKQELAGNYLNRDREWMPKGRPEEKRREEKRRGQRI